MIDRKAVGIALSTLTLLSLFALRAQGVGTRRFALSSGDDFKGGDLQGVAVDSTGKVRAGLNLGAVELSDVTSVWSALVRRDGSVLLGTGNEGKLLEAKGAKVKVVAETKSLVITSIIEAWGGTVLLGTLPEGKIFQWQGGKLKEFVRLKDTEHIWQLAYDPQTQVVLAATGPEGKLWRITRTGQTQVFFDAEEPHLMSLAVAPGGVIYTGSSDKAKLYRLTGAGRSSVLYDFARTEVRAISVDTSGNVYAIANELKGGSFVPKAPTSQAKTPAQPSKSSSGAKPKGKGVLYRFSPDGAPEELLDDTSEHFVGLALDDKQRPYVGTGFEGRIYTVDSAHNSVLVADTEERQVQVLLLTGKNRFVVTSDPPVLRAVRGVGGSDAVWTSKVLDAGIRARFGRADWVASGKIEFSTRTGNTQEPDDSWSDWSRPFSKPSVVTSPPGRYLQIRGRFNLDPDAVLSELLLPFVTDNLRALLTEVEATGGVKKTLSGGSLADGVEESGGPVSDKADTKVNLKWKVDNPDKDQMRYWLQYRLVGTRDWFDILKPQELLTSESYTWDTADLPEGRYRIRVRASDELSNPPPRVKTHEMESGLVLVDNTPPTIEGLRVVGRSVEGTALDGVGPIQRIEVSRAGSEEWFPFDPADGIFDEQREEFRLDLSGLLDSGPAIFALRVYDSANNYVVRHVTLK